MRVVLIGATGLIGRSLARRLAHRHDLHLLGRRPSGIEARETVAPMADWHRQLEGEVVDVAISTLGTTIKQAGSWDAFEAVDRHAVAAFARAAHRAGARQFISVSSVGASPKSRNAYLAMKGRVECDLAAIGFDRLDIVRPGLLRGKRGGELRLAEQIGIIASPILNLFLRGSLDHLAAIDAATVAAAISRIVGAPNDGEFVHQNRDLSAIISQE